MIDEEKEVIVSEPGGEHGGGNPYHEPAGSPHGGEFAEGPKTGSSSSSEGGETAKPSLSSLLSAHREKFKSPAGLKGILGEHKQKYGQAQQYATANEPVDFNNIISLKNFREWRKQYVDPTMSTRIRLSSEQIADLKNHCDPIIKKAMLGCNFWFSSILDFIESDEILNQFGAARYKGRSHGMGSGYTADINAKYHARAKMSFGTFGSRGVWQEDEPYDATAQDLSSEEILENRCKLEKYGCLMDNDPYEAVTNRIASGYGDAYWIMDDRIKDRTTFTLGDSLGAGEANPKRARDEDGIPSFINDGLDPAQCQFNSYDLERIKKCKNIHELTYNGFICSYIECQMHGQLKISRDVYGIAAKPDHWNSPAGRKAVPMLLKMGIRIFTRRTGRGYTEEIKGINPETGEYEYVRY